MPEGNPLVAEAPQDGDGPGPLTSGNGDHGWATGIGIAESAIDAFNGIKDGNWIEGGLGVLGLAAEGAAAAIDPFGWLMSSVASFLMEHIQPLKDMLDSVCGDPPVIQSYSETWANVASHLEETQVTFANAVKNGTTGWTGEAADAYRASCKEQEETIAGAATTAGAISTVVMVFGEVVAFVRETVRDLIADLVGKLISWVLETVCTLGFGTPVVVAQAVTAIAKWATKIADLLKKLTESIRRVSPLLGKLADIFGSIMKVCGKIMGKITGLDVIDTKNIIDGGFVQRLGRGGDGPDLGGNGSGSGGSGSNGGSGSDGGSGSGGSGSDTGDGAGGDSGSGGDANPSGDSPRSDRTSGGNGGSQSGGTEGGTGDRGADGDSSPGSASDGGGPGPDSSRPGSDRGGDDPASGSPRGNAGDPGSPSASPGSSGGRGGDGGSPSTLRSDTPNTVGASDSANTGGRPTSDHQSTSTTRNPATPQPSPDTPGPAASPAASHPTPSHPTSSTPPSPDSSAPHSPAGDRPAPSTPGHSTPGNPGGSDPGAPPRADGPAPSPHPSPGSPNAPHTPSHQSPGPAYTDPGGPRPSGVHHTDSTTTSGLATSQSSPPSTPAAPRTDGFSPPPQRGPDAGPSTPNSPQPMSGSPAPHGSPGANPPSSAPGGRGGSPRGWTGTPGSPGARPHADVPPTRPGPDGPPHRPPTRPQGHHPHPGPQRPGPAPEPHAGGPRPTPSAHAPTPPHAPRGFTPQPGPANTPHVPPGGRPFGPSPDAGPGPRTRPPSHSPGPQQPHAPQGPHAPRPNQPGPNPSGRPDAGVPPQRPSHGPAPDRSNGDGDRRPYRRPDDGRDGGPRDQDSRPDGRDPRHDDRHDRDPGNRDPHDRDGDRDGTRDDHDPHGNDDRPTPEQVNQRHAERTPAGTSFHRGDPEMGDLPHRVKPDPDGRYTVDVHVTPEGNARIGNREYSPEEFAEILRRNGDYDGRPIRLIGCDASSNDFAQRLSRELDTEVLAPNKPAWTDSNGNVFSSDYEIGPDGKPRPKIPPNGEWSTHSPDGSTTRASDDGFTPDTADANKSDVDADSAEARGQRRGPSEDPDEGDSEPAWRRQEDELRDPQRQAEYRRNPQAVSEFEPPSRTGDEPEFRRKDNPEPLRGTRREPIEVGRGGDSDVRPPRENERFPTDQDLQPNTAYRVYDENGTLRGVYHTDDTRRVTHIESSSPNVPPRLVSEDSRPNQAYQPNPDVVHPHPNTTYRVEIDGHHQIFRTDADGLPEPSVRFERPTVPSGGTIDRNDPLSPAPGKPFDPPPGSLKPHHSYDVYDQNGIRRGTYYTDSKGDIRWMDVKSGRLSREHPDTETVNRRFPNAEVHHRQRFDPARDPAPPGVKSDAKLEKVELHRNEPFLTPDRQLEPDRKYVVESEYNDNGKKKYVRAVYWTDSNCDVVVAEHALPHHPDLNNPKPNVVYNVDDGKFVYRTGPEVGGGETDTVAGSGNELEKHDESDIGRRDDKAQKTSGNMGTFSDGGHLNANELKGPGELINMMTQWRAQNQGRRYLGPDDHWRAMERDLVRFLDRGGTIKNFSVFPMRHDGDRVPHTIQVRWVEISPDGEMKVHMRSFSNGPNPAN